MSPSKVPLPVRDPGHHAICGSFGPQVHMPNDISISSAAVAWLTVMTNNYTDYATPSVATKPCEETQNQSCTMVPERQK